jgi:hypothetical protein
LTQPRLSDTDKSIAMESSNQRRQNVPQLRAVVISICISIIRITFEQHAGA